MRTIDAERIRIKPEFMHDVCGTAMIRVEDIARILNEQPTIEPQQQWTPCKERPPETTDHYLVTVRNWNTPQQVDYFSTYTGWMEYKDRVIAWMPLPVPFREDDNGRD